MRCKKRNIEGRRRKRKKWEREAKRGDVKKIIKE